MSLTLDISDDFTDLMDNTEQVTVGLVRSGGTTSVVIADANRATPRKSRSGAEPIAITEGRQATWGIPDKQLNPSSNGREIAVDDTITQGSIVWIVQSADLISLGSSPSYWQCVCRERT